MRRFATAVAAAMLAGLAIGGPGASPAAAHDVLVGSSPEDGATVTEAPDAVTLTFNNAIQDRFAQVAVLDADETPVQEGEAQVSGPTVTQPIGELPDGDYTISYRIVSSDGHPVSGELTFTVSAGGSAGEAAPPTDTPASEPPPDDEPADAESDAAEPASADDSGGGPSTLVVVLVVALAALVVAGVTFVAVGGRRGGDTEDTGS